MAFGPSPMGGYPSAPNYGGYPPQMGGYPPMEMYPSMPSYGGPPPMGGYGGPPGYGPPPQMGGYPPMGGYGALPGYGPPPQMAGFGWSGPAAPQPQGFSPLNHPAVTPNTVGFNAILGSQTYTPLYQGATLIGPEGGYATVNSKGAFALGSAAAFSWDPSGILKDYSVPSMAYRRFA